MERRQTDRRKVGNNNPRINNLYDTDDLVLPIPPLSCSEQRGALEVESFVVRPYHASVTLCSWILAGLDARKRDGPGLKGLFRGDY